jgi:RNA polymerase sigma-70 factor (ECF subfamily)
LFADAHAGILGMLFYCLGHREDARDVLQEKFLKCWHHREKIETVHDLRAWVFQIGLNTARDYRQSAWNHRRPLMPEKSLPMPVAAASNAKLVHDELVLSLRLEVMHQRLEYREVFLLRQNSKPTYE